MYTRQDRPVCRVTFVDILSCQILCLHDYIYIIKNSKGVQFFSAYTTLFTAKRALVAIQHLSKECHLINSFIFITIAENFQTSVSASIPFRRINSKAAFSKKQQQSSIFCGNECQRKEGTSKTMLTTLPARKGKSRNVLDSTMKLLVEKYSK